MNKGRIHQVIGPVIDIKFNEDEMPELMNAVEIYEMTSPGAWPCPRRTVCAEAWRQPTPAAPSPST